MKNECLLQFYMENIDQNHSKCLVNLNMKFILKHLQTTTTKSTAYIGTLIFSHFLIYPKLNVVEFKCLVPVAYVFLVQFGCVTASGYFTDGEAEFTYENRKNSL